MKNFSTLLITLLFIASGYSQTILKDIIPGDGSGMGPYPDFNYNNSVMAFWANTNLFSQDVWKSNGTSAGTVKIASTIGANFQFIGNKILFTTSNLLYITDGNLDQQQVLFEAEGNFLSLTVLGQKIIGLIDRKDSVDIIVSDGSVQGTRKIATMLESIDETLITYYEDNMVITDPRSSSQKFKPIITDGTSEGTMYVSEFAQDLGIEFDFIDAFGGGNALVLQSSNGAIVYSNGVTGQTLRDGQIEKVLNVGDWLVFHCTFGFSVYNIKNEDTNTTSLNPLSFSGTVSKDSCVYYIAKDNYVHEFNPYSRKDRKVSSETIVSDDFQGFLKINSDWIYYPQKGYNFQAIRRVNINSLEDESVDTLFHGIGLIIDYSIAFVGSKIIYLKGDDKFGWEWWVKDGTVSNKLIPSGLGVNFRPTVVKDYIYFNCDQSQITKVIISDISGRVIKQFSIDSNQEDLLLSDLTSGNYLITFVDEIGRRETFKITKQ